jgi:hypothetical protein
MLKTSFTWSSMDNYMIHLKTLSSKKKITAYSIILFEKFMNAVKELSQLLNIPINQLGKQKNDNET